MPSLSSALSPRRGSPQVRRVAALTVTLVLVSVAYAVSRTRCCAPPPVHVAEPPLERPADFALDFRARTGTVSPDYYHRWRLQIAPDGAARMTWVPGYRDDAPEWSASWTIPVATRDSLWAEFRRGPLWMAQPEPPLPPEEVRHGGGSMSLTVVAAGHAVTLDDDRRDALAEPAASLVARVGALIPDSLMKRFAAQQAAMARP